MTPTLHAELRATIGALRDTLALEDKSLLEGQYAKLPEFAELKLSQTKALESALRRISERSVVLGLQAELDALSKATRRNARLLGAALNGAASAQDRLRREARADCAVGAYGRHGRALHVGEIGRHAQKVV